MPNALDDIRWKLWRAKEHVQAVHDTAHAFLKSDFYRLVLYQDESGRLAAKVGELKRVPPVLSVLIGDAVHNLRSALDNLAFLIAKPTTRGEERDVQFPLVNVPREFQGTCRKRLPNADPAVVAEVERLQPYHSRTWPETALLWQLIKMSNWDKHRALISAAAFLEASRLNIRISGKTNVRSNEVVRGVLEPNAVIVRLEMGYSEADAHVEMDPEFTFMPVFDQRMPEPIRGRPVISTLARTGQFIETEVLPMFTRFL